MRRFSLMVTIASTGFTTKRFDDPDLNRVGHQLACAGRVGGGGAQRAAAARGGTPCPRSRELQRAFALALADPWYRGLDACIVAANLPPARRIQVYRNNILAILGGALESLYPVVRRLIGSDCFGALAKRYVQKPPSESGDLHGYGARFPEFVAAALETRALRYLPDVVRLEWTWHRVFHAADAFPLGLEALARMPPERWPALRLELNPACSLFHSEYPVLRIWQVNQEHWTGEVAVSLNEGSCQILVGRRAGEVEIMPLARGEYALLGALAEGHPLEQAVTLALGADSGFELGASLEKHFRLGTFTRAAFQRQTN